MPAHLKTAPNAKLFLRSFWYRATLKEVAHPDEMHIYTLARCAAVGLPGTCPLPTALPSDQQRCSAAGHLRCYFRPLAAQHKGPGLSLLTAPLPLPPCRSFLLHLSLLDLTCSGFAASKLAASALSVALGAYCKPEWPQSMQQYGSYSQEDLAECKARLVEMQATQVRAGGGRGGAQPGGQSAAGQAGVGGCGNGFLAG